MTSRMAKVALKYKACKSSQDYYSHYKLLKSLRGNAHDKRKNFSQSDWLSVYWKMGKYNAGSHCLCPFFLNGRDVRTAVSL